MPWKHRIFTFLKFFIPLLIWCYLFAPFFGPEPTMTGETLSLYAKLKFYFENISRGVYPLWNPYSFWGIPTAADLGHFGAFNPLLFLMLFLFVMGVSFLKSYLSTIVLYYWLGLWGFYRLAVLIFKDRTIAYWAWVTLLFSSLSFLVFIQLVLLLMWVPSVWFFYFLVKFVQEGRRSSFVGIVFCLMVIMTTYLPFYFLTVLGVVALVWGCLSPGLVKGSIGKFIQFWQGHKMLVLGGCVALLLSAFPAIDSYLNIQNKEVVVPFRQGGGNALTGQGVKMFYEKTKDGGIGARGSWEELFWDLEHPDFPNDGIFYVSLFVFLVLGLSIFSTLDRKKVFLFGVTLILFLITLSDSSWLHRFLFKYIFYFQLMRNMHYFIPFLLTTLVLFAGSQLRWLLDMATNDARIRLKITVYAGILHLCIFFFLKSREGDLISSYGTIILSLIFWAIFYLKRPRWSAAFLGLCVGFLSLLPATEVFFYHNQCAQRFKSGFITSHLKINRTEPKFSFVRPRLSPYVRENRREMAYYHELKPWVSFEDSPGFVVSYAYGFPTYWSYYLSQKVPLSVLRKTTQFKFLLYDDVEVGSDRFSSLPAIRRVYRQETPKALVAPGPVESDGTDKDVESMTSTLSDMFSNVASPALKVSNIRKLNRQSTSPAVSTPIKVLPGNTDDFAVEFKSVNALKMKTNFPERHFLVYNDSYSPHWRLWVNGKPAPIYQANVAFKGWWLPAGPNAIDLRYCPFWGEKFYWGLLALFWGIFVYLVVLIFTESQYRDDQ